MVLNFNVKIEDLARQKGEQVANDLKNLKYFRFDTSTNSFVQYADFMAGAVSPGEIRKRRNIFTAEMMFCDMIAKHIAMITAPTKEDRENVMDSWFDDIRIDRDNQAKFTGLQSDNYGYDPKFDLSTKKRDYDNFVKYQNIICDHIEKVLPLIELPREFSFDPSLLN